MTLDFSTVRRTETSTAATASPLTAATFGANQRRTTRRSRAFRATLASLALTLGAALLTLPAADAHAYGGSSAECVSYGPGFQYVKGSLPYRGAAYNFKRGVVEHARLWARYGIFDAGTHNRRFSTGWYSARVSDRGTTPVVWLAPGGNLSIGMTWIWDTSSNPPVTRGQFDIWEFLYVDQGGRRYGPFREKLATCWI